MLTEWLGETSIVGMVLAGSWIAKLVLFVLAMMSALSWAVIIIKVLQYIHIRKQNRKFYQIYLNESSLNQIKKVALNFVLNKKLILTFLVSFFSFLFSW